MVKPILTPAEMAEADRRTIEAGTPVEVLMDRAGRAVAWAVRKYQKPYGARVTVVCGKGNNGGDGLVAARVLRGWGAHVDVFDLEHGVDEPQFQRSLDRADVFVDAMYGTGFRGALEGAARWIVDAVDRTRPCVVAVDIPSGVDGLTGQIADEAVWADETVCFAALKPGLVFEPGRSYAGGVHVVDIGVDIGVDEWDAPLGVIDLWAGGSGEWSIPERTSSWNKWRSGLLVVGGSAGMTGAPMLVSHAAMRAGAGIVWCAVPGREAADRASGTEVITKALPATGDGMLAGVGDILDSINRFKAVAVGPGLGTADATRAAVRELVAQAGRPMVLDADGLNAFAGEAAALRQRPAPTVLTPHDAEYERLLGEPVAADRIDAARRLAQATGCVALLKGAATVIAEPDGRAVINPTGTAALATAGTGDVLTGIIGGFLASGAHPFEAAATAAFVHGRAADVAGHTGLIASDLVAALPEVLSPVSHRLEP